ncbi:hypothetical protein HGRIS_009877 [Hohenbuehelia grisea]|uniref:NmrA-like domain-containing protein n=1 Tax=Hohenbuehelia grisea TaxID=104357 RepID=A0ABR3J2V8_9AGAR
MPAASRTLFFLGATGYLGSQFLTDVAKESLGFRIVALVRSPTEEARKWLASTYTDLEVVMGTLDDEALITEHATKADVVINAASSDQPGSIKAILAGLKKNSSANPGKPPLYTHVSGCGIVSDNCRGEHVDLSDLARHSDIGFDLGKCDPINTHLDCDKPIVEAGIRKENPIRTIIVFPAAIYGVGDGMQPVTAGLRVLMQLFTQFGRAGTWGKGLNRTSNIHVKDTSTALLTVLKAALEGKAEEGAEGLLKSVALQCVNGAAASVLFGKGLLKEGGTKPLPDEVVAPFGHFGWSLFGGNWIVKPERLAKLGWEAAESSKVPFLESLPREIEIELAKKK